MHTPNDLLSVKTLPMLNFVSRLPLWRRVVPGALAACLFRPFAGSSSRQSNAPDQLRSLSDNEGFHGRRKVMQKQRLKIMLRSGVALLILVGWSATARAQPTPTPTPWTALKHRAPAPLDTCLLLTDGTVMCHEYGTNRWHRLKPDINGSYQKGSWDVPGFIVADMRNGNDASFGCVDCTRQPFSLRPCCPTAAWLSSAANT